MAGYREHISVSGLCGACYGVGATMAMGFTPVQGALAGVLTWVSGMLPDVDSESGRPVREIFALLAAVVPVVMMRRTLHWGGDPEAAMLLSVVLYAAIKYGGQAMLGLLSVHRGMFHSIPALVIAAELTFLAYKSELVSVRLLMACGVALGFFSHLLLDEIYAVQWTGVRIKLNKAAGSALKLFGQKLAPNLFAWSLLVLLTYATLIDMGLVTQPDMQQGGSPLLRQAAEELPARH